MIKETDIGLMRQFISDKYGDLKVEGRYINGVIISQGKYNLFGNDKNKIRDHQKKILDDVYHNKYIVFGH
jgi:hypothetical protein